MTPASVTEISPQLPLSSTSRVPAGAPRLSIVIVNYKQWRNAKRVVDSLLQSRLIQSGEAELIIVDNAAQPNKLYRRLRQSKNVSISRRKRNHGFAKAVNEGWARSRGEWLLLLNPDVSLARNFLDVLHDALIRWSKEKRAGIVGFRLLDRTNDVQGSTGADPSLRRVLAGLLRPRARRKCQPLQASKAVQVPWVTGCGMLIRRECLGTVGGFDTDFFMYYEDADLCRRARVAGWHVWHDPSLELVHHHPLHMRPVPAHLRLMTRHSLLTYAFKHWPAWQFNVICRLAVIDAIARKLWSSLVGRKRSARIFGIQRAMANDCRLGFFHRAYRRVWRVAQLQGRCHERPRKPR